MTALPELSSPTVDAIYRAYESDAQPPRPHLGASMIGKACLRELWYLFRWCGAPEFSGRMRRLLDTGQREEERVVADLRRVGVTVHEVDPATQKQFRFITCGGHFGGSLDGALKGLLEAPKAWHLLEIKTHNTASFVTLKQTGVERAKPQHAAQMQTYMGLSGLKRAVYFAVNKDTDELYIERLHYDAKQFEALIAKAHAIVSAKTPPSKVSDQPDELPCSSCVFVSVCHDDNAPPVHCRSCLHATPRLQGSSGAWRCDHHQRQLTFDEQLTGCGEHLYIPQLLAYAEPVDRGDGWLQYHVRTTGVLFANVAASSFPAKDIPHYTSSELSHLHPSMIGHPTLEAIRTTFDAEVTG